MLLDIPQIIALARRHHFTTAELPDLCAVVMTESGGRTDAVQRGGLGRGLVQIDLGQHPSVTEAQAFDPDYAMEFAWDLSRNASGLGPTNWYGPRDWPTLAEVARTSARDYLSGKEPMQLWHPDARIVHPTYRAGGSFIGCAWKVCLHTTEGGGNYNGATKYHDSQSYPHFEVQTGKGITQFLPIDRSAYALYNGAEYGDTNNANIIQIEIVGTAVTAPTFGDDLLGHIASVIRFVHEQTGMAYNFGLPFRPPFTEGTRLTGTALHNYEGILGHQHVGDGNDHTDPGKINVAELQRLLGPSTPEVPLSPSAFRVTHGGLDWVFDGPSHIFYATGTQAQLVFLNASGVKERGAVDDTVFAMLSDMANAWTEG